MGAQRGVYRRHQAPDGVDARLPGDPSKLCRRRHAKHSNLLYNTINIDNIHEIRAGHLTLDKVWEILRGNYKLKLGDDSSERIVR